MAKLTILRGLPGSGKSTYAQRFPSTLLLEADMYFMRDGVYRYEGRRIKDAHTWCQSMCRLSLANNVDVMVANTFTTMKEIRPYLDMTWDKLEVIKLVGQFENVHGVPQDVLTKMKQRWQDYEGEVVVNPT